MYPLPYRNRRALQYSVIICGIAQEVVSRFANLGERVIRLL